MLVKDLIHLLQTRCDGEEKILLASLVKMKNPAIPLRRISGQIPDSFEIVSQSRGECVINIGGYFINNLLVEINDIDIEKATHGFISRKDDLNASTR